MSYQVSTNLLCGIRSAFLENRRDRVNVKIFCVTGTPSADLEMLSGILADAGVSRPAIKQHKENSLTLPLWHERVLNATNDSETNQPRVQQPGRLWEQLASSIFLDNMDVGYWAWADSRSTWLLDFWRDFEPNIHFVLLYTSPLRFITEALSTASEIELNVNDLLSKWQLHQQEILRFHHRHPQRSILVNAEHCAADPNAFVQACSQHWKIKLPTSQGIAPRVAEANFLALHFAQQILQSQTQILALQNELEASLLVLRTDGPCIPQVSDAIAHYRQLQQISAQTKAQASAQKIEIETLQQQKNAVEQEFQIQREALNISTQERDQLSASKAQLEQQCETQRVQIAQFENGLQQTKAALQESQTGHQDARNELAQSQAKFAMEQQNHATTQQSLKEARAENVARLQQLQQAHENLEQVLIEARNSNKNDTTHKAITDELRSKLDAANNALSQLQEQLTASEQKNGQLQQVHQQQLTALRESTEQAGRYQNEIAQYQAAQREQLQASQQQTEQAQVNLKECTAENALLLAQLHQIQVELEHYFVSWKDAVQQISELNSRWQRMLAQNPAYYEYQAGRLDDIEVEGSNFQGILNLSDLTAAGRHFRTLQCTISITDNLASLSFTKPENEDSSVFLRWPKNQDGTPISRLLITTDHHQLDTLTELSTSDLALQRVICQILVDLIHAGKFGDATEEYNTQIDLPASAAAIMNLQSYLQNLPPAIHFDSLRLKSEQINPDYEHLWLEFGNFSFGDKNYGSFEFRVSCANVRPKKFGGYPKLEFPAVTGQAPLEKWFDESFDDFGDKLELRFALPESMDINIWGQISDNDRIFLRMLIAQLPTILKQLEQAKIPLARPWEQWLDLANNIQEILQIRTLGLASTQATPAPAPVSTPTNNIGVKPNDLILQNILMANTTLPSSTLDAVATTSLNVIQDTANKKTQPPQKTRPRK